MQIESNDEMMEVDLLTGGEERKEVDLVDFAQHLAEFFRSVEQEDNLERIPSLPERIPSLPSIDSNGL